MRGPKKEHWMHLCELIAEEEDPARFSELTKELLAELDAKDRRLKESKKGQVSKEAGRPDQSGRSSEDTSRP